MRKRISNGRHMNSALPSNPQALEKRMRPPLQFQNRDAFNL